LEIHIQVYAPPAHSGTSGTHQTQTWQHADIMYTRLQQNFVLPGNWTLIPHLVVTYFIHWSSPSIYSKNSLQYRFHDIFLQI